MSWLPLACFHDPTVPKLDNLRRAAAAGLRVPVTCWLAGADVDSDSIARPEGLGDGLLIVRSGSPTEDGRTTSNAGQLLSLMVSEREDFAAAVRRVAAALPRDAAGRPRGAVFVQPVIAAEEAGVAFFDGFYYERTVARRREEKEGALNVGLTAGQARGAVTRGHLERAEEWSEWLSAVYAVFGSPRGDPRLDVEWARDAAGHVLLQVRPALFPLFRNQLLTVANLKETLGDPPSPWTVSAMVEAARGMAFMRTVDAEIDSYEEDAFIELAGRIWLNASVWYRYLDSMGLPRTLFSRWLGGVEPGPADGRVYPGRLLANLPRFSRQLLLAVRAILTARRTLAAIDGALEEARDLAGLYRAQVRAWEVSVYTALAIAGTCGFVLRLRQALGISGAARLVTQNLMDEYHRLGGLTDGKAREAALDAWLARHGHRGPRESDCAQPRFAELREVLLRDLARLPPPPPAPLASLGRRLLRFLLRPFFFIEERREWFRDECMRRLYRARLRMLDEGARLVAAGQLDAAEDVFWLHGEDLHGKAPLREAAARGRARHEAARALDLPTTATRAEIEELLARSETRPDEAGGQRVFPGIALGPAVIEGTAHVAADLVSVLREAGENGTALGPGTILVVPTLEPSWAVLFPRVGGVVAEVGGELSHASILLREAGRPALVNVAGIFRRVRTGDRLRLDGRRGIVELLGR